ncbi:TMEM175 family protein [Hymenobacter coalescens]
MHKGRLEAFSDGVLAIIITIMVLELKVPHGVGDLTDLRPLVPVFLSYVLSFIYIGIYWNNHHHMLSSASHISGAVLWANLHLLFWLSLVPFATGWMGENHFAPATLLLYGVVLLMSGVAYWLLQQLIIRQDGPNSVLAHAIGRDLKGKASPPLYLLGITSSLWLPWLAGAVYVFVALMWLIPDRRIERTLVRKQELTH